MSRVQLFVSVHPVFHFYKNNPLGVYEGTLKNMLDCEQQQSYTNYEILATTMTKKLTVTSYLLEDLFLVEDFCFRSLQS